MAEQRKAVIKNADMSEAMQQDAVDVASMALSKYNIEKVRQTQTDVTRFLFLSYNPLTIHVFSVRMLRHTLRKSLTKNITRLGTYVFLLFLCYFKTSEWSRRILT